MKIDPKIKKDLEARLKEDLANKKKQVVLISAYKLDKKELAEVTAKVPVLKKADVRLEVDPSIIAGYIVKVGSKVLDLSLSGQLQNFKKIIYGLD
ncbi:MAG: F0F1 ATP synthase subunit delta [Patescibacteria group bacterium]